MCRIRIERKVIVSVRVFNGYDYFLIGALSGDGTSPLFNQELVVSYGDFLAHASSFTTLWKAFMAFSMALRWSSVRLKLSRHF